MSNFPDAHKVYDLAATFRERVIEQGRSFLWPDQEIWTVDNAEAAFHRFLENLDPKTFDVRSIGDKGREHSAETAMIAADAYAIAALTPNYSLKLLESRLNQFFEQPDVPIPNQITLGRVFDSHAIKVPATLFHYSGLWPQRITAVIGVCWALADGKVSESSSYEQIRQTLEEHDLVNFDLHHHGIMELLQLLYPDEIPVTAGIGSTDQVINGYQNLLGDLSGSSSRSGIRSVQDNDRLKLIHRTLSPETSFTESVFFNPENINQWISDQKFIERFQNQTSSRVYESDPTPSVSHIVDDRAPVYEIVRLFKEKAFEQGRSLLWPEHEIWTEEIIHQFLSDFRENSASKDQGWLETFRIQTIESDPRTAMLLADAYAVIMQFAAVDHYRGATKASALNTVLEWVKQPADQQTLQQVTDAFNLGIGAPGIAFTAAISHQIAYVPLFVQCLERSSNADIQIAADEAVELARNEYNFLKSTIPARNIVLHLFESERFERIASRSHKIQIVDSFSLQLEDLTFASDDLDAQIREIRSRLAGHHFAIDFDFYDHDVSPYWDGDQVLGGTTEVLEEVLDVDSPDSIAPPTITDLAAATFLDETHLQDIESLLKSRKQLIFEGPPGSGKTFVAQKFARYVTGQSLTDKRNERVELVQFHQSYSYEDFVEGIRPETVGGQLHYNVKPGIFREFADKAWSDLDNPYVLIIDEINRGNVSRILGELMLLLEYRDETATLPYSQQELSIPPNLYIIGTMNSADRSLSQIDYALRRRFYFVRFLSVENGEAKVLGRWLDTQNLESDQRHRILRTFIELNAQLRSHLDTDDLQIGHSYFMNPNIGNEDFRKQVWKYAVIPLIREYLYHHRDRDELLQSYELQRLIRIVQPIAEETGETTERLIQEASAEVSE